MMKDGILSVAGRKQHFHRWQALDHLFGELAAVHRTRMITSVNKRSNVKRSSPSLISAAAACGKMSEAVLPRISERDSPHTFSHARLTRMKRRSLAFFTKIVTGTFSTIRFKRSRLRS